ncbi:DEAD/DEAH box helicase family protein [Candidatus Pacearchaeota archaeon]|nr:DEAD/DEAH box helicase family protein [Candidatus Pacearchaeota archaeon]
MNDLNENQTREEYIDVALKEVGWINKYIKKEINSVKSIFDKKNFKTSEDGIEKGIDRFIDYLLVNEQEDPIGIIEAKRFSLDAEKGTIQASVYAKDIAKQIGHIVPIFLTNGKEWYLKEERYPTRKVSGPFSQDDLDRRFSLQKIKKDLSDIEIPQNIVDRAKSIEVVRTILEHLNNGYRNALINMATGTGKTRVSMAIIKSLINAGFVRNVLFVVDRISLGRQAKASFDEFLQGNPSSLLNEEGEFDKNKNIYVSTVQTLMAKDSNVSRKFQKFSPGFFDLIVFDEAHRSYYDKQNLIFKYFDSIKIGLTATPSKSEDRNTYDLFNCERGKPTASYTYDEAVNDEVLVPYDAQIISTNVTELGIRGMELDKELKTELIKQDEDPEQFEVPGKRFAKYFTDEKTNELIIREFLNRCYKDESGKPCKTIFFCVNVEHAKALERTFRKISPKLADKDVSVIVSSRDYYMAEVENFKKDSSPRIALSVGVLDTGVDIPEICNLVFVTPVFSHTRFWQMLGRGTRSISACKHKEWLPILEEGYHDKRDFRILDFKFGDFSNINEHQLEKSDKSNLSEDIRIKIFNKELGLLEKNLTDKEKEIIEKHVLKEIGKIDQKSFIVRDKVPMIKNLVSKKYNLLEHIKEIQKELSPLMKFSDYGNGKVQTFISKCIDLFIFVKEGNLEAIESVKDFTIERLENIWSQDLTEVKKNKDLILEIMQDKFWDELTFEDIDMLIIKVAPLMKYFQKEKKMLIRVDKIDELRSIERKVMEVRENPNLEEFKKSELAQKMVKEGVTSIELKEIEKQLRYLNSSWSIDNVQKVKDYILFLRDILDLHDLPDPEIMIRREFERLIILENKNLNSEQIKFLRMLGTFFAIHKNIERKDIVEHPLGDENPLSKFNTEQLNDILEKVKGIRMR